MPNPIQSATDPCICSLPEAVTADESTAQMSLISSHPADSAGQRSAPAASAATAASSPGASALVSRFTTPTAVHPPVEPSLAKALLDCGLQAGNLAVTSAIVIGAVPETMGASLLGAARITLAAGVLQDCVVRDETQQIAAGNRANQAADCASAGAVALTAADGSVLCAR